MEGCLGEESFQMWELNRRLEAYLARVKALEEHYELLSTELVGLRAQSGDASWRARADDELAALRALVDQRWREKHAAEMARDSLEEEAESVAGRCQQQRLARERMAEEMARSRRAVEAEKCAQAWLSSRAAELERELEALRAAHEEERASLTVPVAGPPCRPSPPRGPPAPGPEVEELVRRLGEAWRGAVLGYQERVARMETALSQARQRLGRVVQGARKGRLELQQLQAERGGLQDRRAALVQRLEGCWQERLRATEKFQLAVEALEQEKQDLQSQIAQVLEGRQQLSRLKMSLSLEVATYRTLLEAENSRLQVPGCGSKASFSFQDPKLELHFPGTPEGRRLGPLLSVLSPTPLSSPLPNTLETPVPAFLKSQEFLPARTSTLASTPIPPTPQAPCPATDGEIRAQDAPLSVLQPQVGRQQVPQATQAEANIAITASILPGPEKSGERQQEASTDQSPEDHASLAPPLIPDHLSLEAKDGEPGETRLSSRFQEKGEGQMWELAEKEIAVEVKVVSSLQQQTQQKEGDLDMRGIQESQGLLEKDTLKSLEEEIQEPLMFLEKHSHETLRSLEKENQELLKSLEEKDMEVVRTLEKETLGLLTPIGKEDPQTLQSLGEENQELMRSLEDNPETFLYSGKENQELVRSLEGENLESLKALEKQIQEPLRSLEEEDQKALGIIEKVTSLKSLEEENQETLKSLEKENQEPLRSLEQEDQETMRPLEKETQQPLMSLGEKDQMTLRPLEKVKPEPLKSLGKDQGIFRPLEKENQELLISLKEESVDAMRCLEIENLESLKCAGEDLEILKSTETQEPLWSLEEMNQKTTKPLEKEIQEPLASMEENQESPKPLEKENQESLRPLGNLRTPEEVDKESQRYLQEEETLEKGENQESLRSLEEEGQELLLSANQQRWEDTVVRDQRLDQEKPSGRAGVSNEDEAELDLRERGGIGGKEESAEEGELQLTATGGVWSTGEGHPGGPEPKEQRVSAEGTSREGDAEGLLDPEGQPEHTGAPDLQTPWGMSEVLEPVLEDADKAPGGGQAPRELILGLETAGGESDSEAEQGLEQEMVELEDPGHLAREEVMEPPLGEEGFEAKRVQGLEGPGKDLEEAAALEPELPILLRKGRDPLESHGAGKELEPETPWGAMEVFPAETLSHDGSDTLQSRLPGSEEAEKDAGPVLGPPSPGPSSPSPTEPCLLTPVPEDASGPQPLAEGSQEASGELEGSAEALEKVEGEKEELGSGGLPEGLQDEGEESRDESEADELGETLPDSTPLALYLRCPASPRWDLAEEQRPSPQGETRKEGWDPALLTPEGCGAHPEEEEEEERGEEGEECGQDSDLSEEFEDVGTEGSIPPGVARELMEPLGQVSQLLLEPAAWGQDGESDGFADEEESGEEGEEEEEGKEPGVGQWRPGSPVGGLPALSRPQSGNLLGPETVNVSIPWDDGLRGAAADDPTTVLETESQDSTEPSGSEEESDAAPSEREDQVCGPLGTLGGREDTPGVNGQGPSLKKELEHVNGGVVSRLEQSAGGGQGKLGALEGDQGSPLEEEGGALKTPWAGAPLPLGPGQLLKFTPREGDGDSWSSGED
ncbi:nestin [Pteronotus mesoamericanus]|uniref:nestin n=1 Tax=Pteronotus mesoamericanus TaxID=1884717 RepID=UPI0023EC1D2F|nr:nestin [Pteronotus parnellii mesoamericanus]